MRDVVQATRFPDASADDPDGCSDWPVRDAKAIATAITIVVSRILNSACPIIDHIP